MYTEKPMLKRIGGFIAPVFALVAQVSVPPTPRRPVTDTYHSVKITDDYRWLEDFDNPEVKQWSATQNKVSRAFLDALPGRDAIVGQLRPIFQPPKARYGLIGERKGVFFAQKSDPQHQHPVIVTLTSLDDLTSEHVVLDPDALDPKHLTAVDFTRPSVDGRYLAVSLSQSGSESGDVHIYEVASGNALPDVIPQVNYATAGGDAAWNAESTGFYYTRYPRDGERPAADMHFYQQVYFHKLGDKPENDRYSIGKEFPRIAEIALTSSQAGRYIAASVAIGDGGDHEDWILTPGHPWRQLARVSDNIKDLAFGYHDDLFLISKNGARRGKVLHLGVNDALAQAKVVVPESQTVIESVSTCHSGLFVNSVSGGPSEVRFFPAGGQSPVPIALPAVSTGGCGCFGESTPVCYVGTYLDPGGFYHYKVRKQELTPTALRIQAPVPLDDFEVVRDFALSKDGTKVPLNIIGRKGLVLDGSHPTLLGGYGGYGVNQNPSYPGPLVVLLEHGFVLAEANLRGGGEYGEDWHEQGKLTKKQNVFDDFYACARYLIDHRYSQPSKLGILGGSNGGLLMGAAFTQHPELYRAVVSMVGIYDMLRVELSPNGAFNITEFGTVKEADQFRALYAYSPYHHVKDETQYPAILMTTGDNDGRVDPMQSRKMTARLQATETRQPTLLRTSSAAGHGFGSSVDEEVDLWTDIDAFLLHELGAEPVRTKSE
jgi:prolyl oligopeptidase